jgi:hypothetical protein
MATPIAAGTVVFTKASFGSIEPEASRPLLGICESAEAPVDPGDPPTNVVVAWEDGTRTEYVASIGLFQLQPASGPSLLGTVMQYDNPQTPLPNPGARLTGPVVMHGQIFDEAGDAINPPGDSVVLKTPLGYLALPTQFFAALPSA